MKTFFSKLLTATAYQVAAAVRVVREEPVAALLLAVATALLVALLAGLLGALVR